MTFIDKQAIQRILDDQNSQIEAAIHASICEKLAGEHGRILPGTPLLRVADPGTRRGYTEWTMPG